MQARHPQGADDETHHPDTVNFSCFHVAQKTTRSHASPLPIIIEECSPSVLEVPPPPPTGLDFCWVTAVQESKVEEKLWHIARVPYNSSKACWAMHAVTKKKCTAKIVSNSKSTLAPAYLGVWNYYKFTTLSTSPEWTFQPTETLILLPGSPSLRDGLPPHHQQNKCRWWHLHELLPRIPLSLTLHCALIDVPIWGPHVNS